MRILIYAVLFSVLSLRLAHAEEGRKVVSLEETPFASAKVEEELLVVELKRPWMVRGPEKKVQEAPSGSRLKLKPNSDITLVERHISIAVTYLPSEGIILRYTFNGGSFGGGVKRWTTVYPLK